MIHWNCNDTTLNTDPATEFHGGWVNYLDSNNDWSPIDCLLVQDGSGFHVTNAPFEFHAPLLSDGEAVFDVNNRYDIFNKTSITADPFSQTIKALGVSSVSGELYDINGDGRLDAVKYPDAYNVGVHLVYYIHHGRAPRLKKLIQFDGALGVDTDYAFELTYSGKTEISPRKIPDGITRLQHYATSEGILNNPSTLSHDEGFYIRKFNEPQKRGIGIKTPLIWDSTTLVDPKTEVIDVDISKGVGQNKYILTKHIKTSFFSGVIYPVFTDTTSTFYPDADPETTSVDGVFVNDSLATWALARDATASASVNTTTDSLSCYNLKDGGGYDCRRSFTLFDTSAIPDTDDISSAIYSIYVTAVGDIDADAEGYMGIVQTSSASPYTELIVGDFDQIGTAEGSDTQHDNGGISTSAYLDFTLNATGLGWISKTGITHITPREGHDIADSAPIGSYNGILFTSAETVLTTSDPKLVVIHGAAPTTGNKIMATSAMGNMIDGNTFTKTKNVVV